MITPFNLYLHSNKLRLKLDDETHDGYSMRNLHSNKLRLKQIYGKIYLQKTRNLHSNKLRLKRIGEYRSLRTV